MMMTPLYASPCKREEVPLAVERLWTVVVSYNIQGVIKNTL